MQYYFVEIFINMQSKATPNNPKDVETVHMLCKPMTMWGVGEGCVLCCVGPNDLLDLCNSYKHPSTPPPPPHLSFPSTPHTVADTMDTHNIQIDQNLSSLDIFNTSLSGQLFFRFP